jgi:hypothetical protein
VSTDLVDSSIATTGSAWGSDVGSVSDIFIYHTER